MLDFEKYDNKKVEIEIADGNRINGILYLSRMDYPKRYVLKINDKFYEEFQVKEIKDA